MATLRERSLVLAKIRTFFERRDFIHVETPLLSRDTVVDRYIEPVVVPQANVLNSNSDQRDFFLQTSPEFAMKRLLASGAQSIYQICKAFRKGEAGRHHNPEFTMLEWYRVGDDMDAGIELLADFAKFIFGVAQVNRLSYRESFLSIAKVDPFVASIEELKSVCDVQRVDFQTFEGEQDRDQWLNLIMSEVVEPELGRSAPTIVYHWPASQSALARVCKGENGVEVAERFELFVDGVELANGYHELLNAEELVMRNDKVNEQRESDGISRLPVESELLNAMRYGLPACSGVAMGIDRLLMVLLDKSSIEEVIAFPIDRA